jgi:hypothetical protein
LILISPSFERTGGVSNWSMKDLLFFIPVT